MRVVTVYYDTVHLILTLNVLKFEEGHNVTSAI